MATAAAHHTFPYIEVKNTSSTVEHEASTSKIGRGQIFYLRQRGLATEDAVNMIVNGFLQRGLPGAADGIRRSKPRSCWCQPRRIGGARRCMPGTGHLSIGQRHQFSNPRLQRESHHA